MVVSCYTTKTFYNIIQVQFVWWMNLIIPSLSFTDCSALDFIHPLPSLVIYSIYYLMDSWIRFI